MKLGVIFLVTILASAGIGTSYACYSDNFHFTNNCSRCCNDHIGVRVVATGDPGPNYLNGGLMYPTGSNPRCEGTSDPDYHPGYNDEGKNVASTIAKNRVFKCNIFKDCRRVRFFEKVVIRIDNAYPWYASSVTLWFGNCGNTPGEIIKIRLVKVEGCEDLLKFIAIDGWEIKKGNTVIDSSNGGTNQDELEAALSEIVLCPNQILKVFISFHFEEEADTDDDGITEVMPQVSSVSFKYKITWKQVVC